MEIKVLGPLVIVADDGSTILLPSAAQRRLASLLALRADSIVSGDALTQHLELSPGALRTSITRLRRSLGNDVLRTIAPGYELRAGSVDWKQFESLLATARSARDVSSRRSLESALALWNGSAYLEFSHEPWALSEVTRLEELRAGAVEDLADLLLESHEWSLCIANLEPLIETQPFRDRPRRLLMEAFARSGRQTDALRAYQTYRRFLLDEVGVEPSAAVVALDRAIARDEIETGDAVPTVRHSGTHRSETHRSGTHRSETHRSETHSQVTDRRVVPLRLDQATRRAFAGRVQERLLLKHQFQSVVGGSRQVALVAGEPGIGKTKLAATAARAAFVEGATVLLGRCDEDISMPYQPWVESLDQLIASLEDPELHSIGLRHLTELAGLVPKVQDRCPEVKPRAAQNPEADRLQLFSAVIRALEVTSTRAPIVLVFDDAQWADVGSLLLLRNVLQSSAQLRLQVIVTYRNGRIEPTSGFGDFLGVLSREDFVERISLSGLLDAEIVELIENVAERSLDITGVALARELRHETDGNPFFVVELFRHLLESFAATNNTSDDVLSPEALRTMRVPDTVRDVVRQRVARLGLTAQHVLRLAAVAGREFDIEVVALVSDCKIDEVIDIVEHAESASLVYETEEGSGRYTFTHALIGNTLYQDLGTARCRIAHRQIGEALEQLRTEGVTVRLSELTHHWMVGGKPNDWMKTVGYAREVGDAAVVALASDEAARWYRTALDKVEQQPVIDRRLRAELLIQVGTTQVADGDSLLLEAARIGLEIGDHELLVRAVLAEVRGWQGLLGKVDQNRISLVASAVDVVGLGDSPARARLLKAYASGLAYSGDPLRCFELDQEAVAIARRLGKPDTLLQVLIRRPVGFWAPDSLHYRFKASQEAAELARRNGDLPSVFWSNHDLGLVSIEAGSRADFEQAAAQIEAVASVVGKQPGFDWLIETLRFQGAILKADYVLAERIAAFIRPLAFSAGNRNASALVSLYLANVGFAKGDERSAIPMLSEVVAQSNRLDSNMACLTRSLFMVGDRLEAEMLLEREFTKGFPIPWDKYWKLATCYWADVVVLTGHQPASKLLYHRLLPWAGQMVAVSGIVESSIDFYLGCLGSLCESQAVTESHFSRALIIDEAVGSPFQLARTKFEWARAILQQRPGDSQGLELLNQVETASSFHGFARLGSQAMELFTIQRMDVMS